MKKIVLLLSLLLVLFSCDVAKQTAGSAYSFTQCEYKYSSISGLTLGGVNLQNVNSLSSLNPLTAAGLLSAFSGNSLPLQFTLNLNVKNPGTHQAALSGLQYILEIDNVQMTEGAVNQAFSVPAGGNSVLPVAMSFDLKKAMSGQSADAVKNLAFNFAGLSNTASKVTLKLRPSMMIGGQSIISPVYIPVSFSYGGK